MQSYGKEFFQKKMQFILAGSCQDLAVNRKTRVTPSPVTDDEFHLNAMEHMTC